MKKNFCLPIKALDGTTFKDGDKEVLLKKICVDCLYAQEVESGVPKRLSGAEHVKRYDLAKRLYDSTGEIEVSAEEVSLLKTLLSSNYITSVVGPAFELLEGKA